MGLDTTGIDFNLALNGGIFVRETFPRLNAALSDQAAGLTTQVMTNTAVFLAAGDLITNVTFLSGAVAAGTPTNWWFALYDNQTTPALVGQTADQLTAAWAASTVKTLPLTLPGAGFTVPFRVQASGIYYVACMVKATTVPSLVCQTLFAAGMSTGIISGQKTLVSSSGAALTTTAPTTIATPAAAASRPYAVLN